MPMETLWCVEKITSELIVLGIAIADFTQSPLGGSRHVPKGIFERLEGANLGLGAPERS